MAPLNPLLLQFTTQFILRLTLMFRFLMRPERATGSSAGQEHVLRTAGQRSHSTPTERPSKTPLKGAPSSRFYSLSGTVAAIQPPTRLAGAVLIASLHDEWLTACGGEGWRRRAAPLQKHLGQRESLFQRLVTAAAARLTCWFSHGREPAAR